MDFSCTWNEKRKNIKLVLTRERTKFLCVGCRKRKEHEDFAENEAKFSKQSPAEDSVTYLMRKWASSTETQEERDTVCPPPPPVPAAVLDEVSLQLTANL